MSGVDACVLTQCMRMCELCVCAQYVGKVVRVGYLDSSLWCRGPSDCGCAGIAGRVAIDVRGRERSRVCAYRISGECCVPEPTGEGTWMASAVPFWRE